MLRWGHRTGRLLVLEFRRFGIYGQRGTRGVCGLWFVARLLGRVCECGVQPLLRHPGNFAFVGILREHLRQQIERIVERFADLLKICGVVRTRFEPRSAVVQQSAVLIKCSVSVHGR